MLNRKRRASRESEPLRRGLAALEAGTSIDQTDINQECKQRPRKVLQKSSCLVTRLRSREEQGKIQGGVFFRSVPSRLQFSFEEIFSRITGHVVDDIIILGWSRDGKRLLSYKMDESNGCFFLWAFDFFGIACSSYHFKGEKLGATLIYSKQPIPLVPSLICSIFPSLTATDDDSHSFDDEGSKNTRIMFWEAPDGKCIVMLATKKSINSEGNTTFHYTITPTPTATNISVRQDLINENTSLHFSYTVTSPFPRPSIASFAQLSSAAMNDESNESCLDLLQTSFSEISVYRLVLNSGNSLRILTFSVTTYCENEIDTKTIRTKNDSTSTTTTTTTLKDYTDAKRRPWFSRACLCVCNKAIPHVSSDFSYQRKQKILIKSLPCSCFCSCSETFSNSSPLSCSSSVATRALVESLSPLYTGPITQTRSSFKKHSAVRLISLSTVALSTLLSKCVRGTVKNFDARIVQIIDSVWADDEASKAAVSFRRSKESVFMDNDEDKEHLDLDTSTSQVTSIPTFFISQIGITNLSSFQQASQLRDARHLLITSIVDHVIESITNIDPNLDNNIGGDSVNQLNSSFATASSSTTEINLSASTASPTGDGEINSSPSSLYIPLSSAPIPPPPPPPHHHLPLLPLQKETTSFLAPLILGTYAKRQTLSRSSSFSSSSSSNVLDESSSLSAFDEIVCADESSVPLLSLSHPISSPQADEAAIADYNSIWKKKSVWAQSRLFGSGSSVAVLLPSKQTVISEPILVPPSDIAIDEFEFKEEKDVLSEHLKKNGLIKETSTSSAATIDSFGSSKRVIVRETAPTRSKLTFLLDVITGNCRVLSLARVPQSQQPGFDNDSNSIISSIAADHVTKQRTQLWIPQHICAEPVELSNAAFLAGKSLTRLVNPKLPIALINKS